jgi:hypothetical protein
MKIQNCLPRRRHSYPPETAELTFRNPAVDLLALKPSVKAQLYSVAVQWPLRRVCATLLLQSRGTDMSAEIATTDDRAVNAGHERTPRSSPIYVTLLAVALSSSGCASHQPHELARDSISTQAPFSKTFRGSGAIVCWSVKRALLSQGYMLDRSNDAGVLTGTRDFQPTPKLNLSYHLQTTCADNRDGTSIVFVTATREDSQLQKMRQTTSLGVGPATLTMPSGSARVLGTVRRETIKDPTFYQKFFDLVQGYMGEERVSDASRTHPDDSHQAAEAPNQ